MMNIFFLVFGVGFFLFGLLFFVLGIALGPMMFVFNIVGLIFMLIGGGFIFYKIKSMRDESNIRNHGTKFTGKIYSYVDDTSVMVNGQYRVNIKVHYFDNNGIEREALVPTKFTRGNGDFPIGSTIDILEYKGRYTWVKNSVRFETLYREEELMDDKPIDPTEINIVGVSCQNCGANFSGAKGYVTRCPYCGAPTNL